MNDCKKQAGCKYQLISLQITHHLILSKIDAEEKRHYSVVKSTNFIFFKVTMFFIFFLKNNHLHSF